MPGGLQLAQRPTNMGIQSAAGAPQEGKGIAKGKRDKGKLGGKDSSKGMETMTCPTCLAEKARCTCQRICAPMPGTPIGGEHYIRDVPLYFPPLQLRRLNEEGDSVPGSQPSEVPNSQDTELARRVIRSSDSSQDDSITAARTSGPPAELRVPRGATRAVEDVLQLARRASRAATSDAAELVVRDHAWLAINGPLIWSAAGSYPSHPFVDWLAAAASECNISFAPGINGSVVVQSMWSAIRSGFRSLGIASGVDLVSWLKAQRFILEGDPMRPVAYLQAHVQVSVLDAAFGTDGGLAGLDSPLSNALVELTLHLSRRSAIHEPSQQAPCQAGLRPPGSAAVAPPRAEPLAPGAAAASGDAQGGVGNITGSQAEVELVSCLQQLLDLDERIVDDTAPCFSANGGAGAERLQAKDVGPKVVVMRGCRLLSTTASMGGVRGQRTREWEETATAGTSARVEGLGCAAVSSV